MITKIIAKYRGCVWQWHGVKHVKKNGQTYIILSKLIFWGYVPFTLDKRKKQSLDSYHVVLTVPDDIKHVKNLGQLISFSQI